MKHEISVIEAATLLSVLKERFEKHMHRHQGVSWSDVEKKLETDSKKLEVLSEMEETGGEPDIAGFDSTSDCFIFYDFAVESPTGRRSLCFDEKALESRKEHKPAGSVEAMAQSMGIELLSEAEYRELQQLEAVDMKTSSWIKTPAAIRKLGGALFGDRRYDSVFVYHNGAESYYAARGFRGSLRV